MRNLNLHTITAGLALAMCMIISVPADAMAQRKPSASHTQQRNRNNGGGQGVNGRRPDSNHNNKGQGTRPDDHRQPGGDVKPNDRPGGDAKPNNPAPKPNGPDHNPGAPAPKPNNPAPAPKPNGPDHHPSSHKPAPHHPAPHHHPMPHPVPPPNWYPPHGVPVIRGVLDLTFGMLYNATINQLLHSNYVITQYTNDAIYLANVVQCGYSWKDAILNFSFGKLESTQFIDSTSWYDPGRYNGVYNNLCNTYGPPMSTRTLSNGGRESVWCGGNREGLVTLEYYYQDGRYYTVLSFGAY